jgi:hypothetical protein
MIVDDFPENDDTLTMIDIKSKICFVLLLF